MKKLIVSCLVMGVWAVVVTGCATAFPAGAAYMKLKFPIAATSNGAASQKVGVAKCTSYLGMVTMGDVSLKTAMKNGGITKIHYVDWEVESIAGIIGKYKVLVYGE